MKKARTKASLKNSHMSFDMREPIDTVVLGASGYVAGELLRLLSGHEKLKLKAAVSETYSGERIETVFPHLQSNFDKHRFCSRVELLQMLGKAHDPVAIFSAARHGASAAFVKEVVDAVEGPVHIVDLSADFRYPNAAAYEEVYKQEHGAPSLMSDFSSALPEHLDETPKHVGHPGCFATALLLSIVPLLKLGIISSEVFAIGVTGSTGSGREPKPTTHHPLRQSNLFAYNPLHHRHVPEVVSISKRLTGVKPKLHFVPHSGPFSRGIYTTVQGTLCSSAEQSTIFRELEAFYDSSPFVRVVSGTPKLKDVVGSNYAHLGVACEENSVAVFSVIDNLTKGAAGGGVQWMNRLLGFPETMGLMQSGPGWI